MKGNERLLRLLVMPRRNYVSILKKIVMDDPRNKNLFFIFKPMALVRPSWKSRGATYTEFGITIRCVGLDQIGQVNFQQHLIIFLIISFILESYFTLLG